MVVKLFKLDEFTIPALPNVIVPIKLESQIFEPLGTLCAQQTLPVPFPLVTDPLAQLRVPCAGRGNVTMAVVRFEIGQIVELVSPASGQCLSIWFHLSSIN
jgi:hypothetical protein